MEFAKVWKHMSALENQLNKTEAKDFDVKLMIESRNELEKTLAALRTNPLSKHREGTLKRAEDAIAKYKVAVMERFPEEIRQEVAKFDAEVAAKEAAIKLDRKQREAKARLEAIKEQVRNEDAQDWAKIKNAPLKTQKDIEAMMGMLRIRPMEVAFEVPDAKGVDRELACLNNLRDSAAYTKQPTTVEGYDLHFVTGKFQGKEGLWMYRSNGVAFMSWEDAKKNNCAFKHERSFSSDTEISGRRKKNRRNRRGAEKVVEAPKIPDSIIMEIEGPDKKPHVISFAHTKEFKAPISANPDRSKIATSDEGVCKIKFKSEIGSLERGILHAAIIEKVKTQRAAFDAAAFEMTGKVKALQAKYKTAELAEPLPRLPNPAYAVGSLELCEAINNKDVRDAADKQKTLFPVKTAEATVAPATNTKATN